MIDTTDTLLSQDMHTWPLLLSEREILERGPGKESTGTGRETRGRRGQRRGGKAK